jgi:succinate dehydrogenase/fumarate reductase flavoprotein subunit
MDLKGQVIPGLYAAGDSASGILLHGIGKATVFGRVAGAHAAQQRPETVTASGRG